MLFCDNCLFYWHTAPWAFTRWGLISPCTSNWRENCQRPPGVSLTPFQTGCHTTQQRFRQRSSLSFLQPPQEELLLEKRTYLQLQRPHLVSHAFGRCGVFLIRFRRCFCFFCAQSGSCVCAFFANLKYFLIPPVGRRTFPSGPIQLKPGQLCTNKHNVGYIS